MEQHGAETPSSDDLSIDWTEERGKTFVVPRNRMLQDEERDGCSSLDGLSVGRQDPDSPSVGRQDPDSLSVGRQDLEQLMDVVMERFEEKQARIKHELRGEFEVKLANDRDEYRKTMTVLKDELSTLTKVSDEYDHLREEQKSLRSHLQAQNETEAHPFHENPHLKKRTTKAEALATENQKLRRENEKLKKGNTRMESEIKKLEANISQKDIEMSALKSHIVSQYHKLKSDITKTCDKWDNEHETLYCGMKQQHLMLTDISKSVKVITKNTCGEHEREQRASRGSSQRPTQKTRNKQFVTGKVTHRTLTNKDYPATNKPK